MTPTMLAVFITAAIVVNVLIYGGIYVTYMGEKSGFFERTSRISTAPAVSPFSIPPAERRDPAELDRAA
jgi:hypothetical protein